MDGPGAAGLECDAELNKKAIREAATLNPDPVFPAGFPSEPPG